MTKSGGDWFLNVHQDQDKADQTFANKPVGTLRFDVGFSTRLSAKASFPRALVNAAPRIWTQL